MINKKWVFKKYQGANTWLIVAEQLTEMSNKHGVYYQEVAERWEAEGETVEEAFENLCRARGKVIHEIKTNDKF